METKPLYKHVCETCLFLGTFNKKDLYVCSHREKLIDTLIARHSDEDSNYSSGLEFALCYDTFGVLNSDACQALFVALQLAKKLGYTIKEWGISNDD
jgi:hypothetical protein